MTSNYKFNMKSKKTNEIWYEETFCLQIAIDSGFAESCSELRISKLSLSLLRGYYETGNKLSDNAEGPKL